MTNRDRPTTQPFMTNRDRPHNKTTQQDHYADARTWVRRVPDADRSRDRLAVVHAALARTVCAGNEGRRVEHILGALGGTLGGTGEGVKDDLVLV